MNELQTRQRAAWAGIGAVVMIGLGVALGALVGVDQPDLADADILERVNDGPRQIAAGIAMPVLGIGAALLIWFATGLRRALDEISDGDPLTHAIVPAAAMLGALTIAGVGLDVSTAVTAMSDSFTPTADIARVLGTAGLLTGLTALAGGAVIIAVSTRLAHRADALPTWTVWSSYALAALCLTSFWTAGTASVAFALWIIGAVVALLREARPATPPFADR
ncbi:MAG: hypothetical protein R3C39_12630 [Dehalococcoidia bacterium]